MGIMYKLMKHRNLNMDLNKPPNKAYAKSNRNRFITIEGNIIEAAESAASDSPEEDLTKNMDSNKDKQFTAEHIIQLCKFLAEKSRRNKNLYKQQQSPKKLTKNKQSDFPFQPVEYDDNDEELEFYQNEALPLLSKQRLELEETNHAENEGFEYKDDEFKEHKASVILATRLSPDINSLNISLNTATATSCALQHHQQQQQQQQQQLQQEQLQQQQQDQQYHQHIHNLQQPQPSQTASQGKRDILLKIRRQIFERKRLRENGAFAPQALNNSQVWRPW